MDLYPTRVGKRKFTCKLFNKIKEQILVRMTSHSGGSPVHVDKVFWYKVR